MKKGFAKDILLIDFESTGLDPFVHDPTQLGAILLDKHTLREKGHFLSYIEADLSKASSEALVVSGITAEKLEGAPKSDEVIKNSSRNLVLTFSWPHGILFLTEPCLIKCCDLSTKISSSMIITI